MAESNSLESLQALYADLLALSESRLSSLERLGVQFNAHLNDFKNLLDKKARSDESRKKLATGTLEVSGDQYSINDEFQQGALKLADELNLDELEAAKIFLEAQEGTEASGQPVLTNSLVRFHQRRKCLLDCLRLLLQQAADVDIDEALREDLRALVTEITKHTNGSPSYSERCLSSMVDVRSWLQTLADKQNAASVTGQQQQQELFEALEYQRVSLTKQHESLAVIMMYLVKEGRASAKDFHGILGTLKKVDKFDNLLVHQIPVLSACIARFGGPESPDSLQHARALHDKVIGHSADEQPWVLQYLHAAFRVLWISEHSGWYGENSDGSLPENQIEEETRQRSKQFIESLKDGAFDFILSVSADVKSIEWHDPARHGVRQWLQRKAPSMVPDSVPFSDFFEETLMEQLENFVDGFIMNMPDVLRRLRLDEDEQRQLSKDHEQELDLERFLVIISYIFEGRPKDALREFWDAPDGSLMGFVHWASRRASTPLVSAFCEMLQSISEDEECATAAHHFLLDEGTPASGKLRKSQSLTWKTIFSELTYFMSRLNPALPQPQGFRGANPHTEIAETEPESVIMLECYLRLITRLASESEAARNFLAHHPSFHLSELLFQLASSAVGVRLRACAFTCLRSLLSHKTREAGEYVWTALDIWVSGGYSPGSMMPKTAATPSMTTTAASMGAIMKGLSTGFEEPNAFVQLLHALVLPYGEEVGLRDELPFPETLGTPTRSPGIDPYIDFALGQIFGRPALELNDLEVVQRRLLQLSCLDFIATCLESFNEDLIILASQAHISVDAAIRTSSLQAYVLLHPFSRVMEWLFNEKIMDALFATVHQTPAEVARAAPDSPLILCLRRGLHVITSILDLQPTYLNIIRPLLKSQENSRRTPVSSAAFANFEEGVLNHLNIFPDLGRYCGTGHPELVIASLGLLERLSSSPKITQAYIRGRRRNRALAALDEDSETISKILLQEMESDFDINQGPDSPAYIIKTRILDFLLACLQATRGQPGIAHLLLGFQCGEDGIMIDPEGSFSRGLSLFHSILNLVTNMPMGDENGMVAWLVQLSYKALQVLKELWASPMSSTLTMIVLRDNNFFSIMFVNEVVLRPDLTWDGLEIIEPAFASSTAICCLSDFLGRRALILEYLSAEYRQAMRGNSPSLKQRLLDTLLGSTAIDDGQKLEHANIFELFDFIESGFFNPVAEPQLSWFDEADMLACSDEIQNPNSTHNVTNVEELLVLRRSELLNTKRLENPHDLALVNSQAQELIAFVIGDNRIRVLGAVRLQVLRSWVQLILVMIKSETLEDTPKIAFVMRALQTIIPRLDGEVEVVFEAMELAKLAKALISSLDFTSSAFKQGDLMDIVSDRLFHLFQISLRAINTLGTEVSLKEIYYNICFRYMAGMSDGGASGLRRRHSMQTIKSAGDRFIDVVCDDAHAGEPTSRIAALLVLNGLVKMGKKENSKYIIDSLIRLNFIAILVESLQGIGADLRSTPVDGVDLQLSYCHARLALLMQISQDRFGAGAVYNAGIFHSVKESGLFAADPDLGVDIAGPGAVDKHYDLLAAIMRIICAIILSRASQNQQTLDQGRRFIADNRLSILTILKKNAGLASTIGESEQSLGDLAESYMLLISLTGYLEFENQTTQQKKQSVKVFSSFT